jgi:hypothetical protein
MQKVILIFVFGLLGNLSFAQKYLTKSGKIYFFSDTPMEKIEATSTTANSVYDSSTGAIEWAVLIKGFKFEKALMEEHFNENYMESTKFPKAKFKGMIDNPTSINLGKDGTYKANVSGTLEMHGVSNPIACVATFVVKDGKIKASSSFTVKVADYKIDIPSVVKDKIAKSVKNNLNKNKCS